jgi:hypothetical protein
MLLWWPSPMIANVDMLLSRTRRRPHKMGAEDGCLYCLDSALLGPARSGARLTRLALTHYQFYIRVS